MPRRAAREREHDALGEELLHQPAASGAERRSHCELTPPRRASGDQQTGDIRARDQQHESDGAEQHEHRRSHIGDHARRERFALERAAGVALVDRARSDRRSISVAAVPSTNCAIAGDARDDVEVVDVAAVAAVDAERRRRHVHAATASTHRSCCGCRRNSGTTPMISVGAPFRRTCVPITAGFAPNCCLQIVSLITATAAPGLSVAS